MFEIVGKIVVGALVFISGIWIFGSVGASYMEMGINDGVAAFLSVLTIVIFIVGGKAIIDENME